MASVTISKASRPRPIYAFNDKTNAIEVSALIDKIRADLKTDMNKVRIFVMSGTHGGQDGSLTGDKVFFLQDKSKELQTVTAVNVDEKTPANTWKKYFDQNQAILILAWCYSSKWNGLATYNK
jgi:hypothetical protein